MKRGRKNLSTTQRLKVRLQDTQALSNYRAPTASEGLPMVTSVVVLGSAKPERGMLLITTAVHKWEKDETSSKGVPACKCVFVCVCVSAV